MQSKPKPFKFSGKNFDKVAILQITDQDGKKLSQVLPYNKVEKLPFPVPVKTIRAMGSSNLELDEVLDVFPGFLGTISRDEINKLQPPLEQDFGFIYNTSPSDEDGKHWIAVAYDYEPNILYHYDSLGDKPDADIVGALNKLINSLGYNTITQLIYNNQRDQRADTKTCGLFAYRFLNNFFKGLPFAFSANINNDEKIATEITDLATAEQLGEGFNISDAYNYVKDAGVRFSNFFKKLVMGRKTPPPSFLKALSANANSEIEKITVHRDPINPNITAISNLATLGQFSKAADMMGYDDLFHLYVILHLKNGKKLLLQKTQVLELKDTDFKPSADMKTINNVNIKVGDLVRKTAELMGNDLFISYNARYNNCQDFVMAVLQSNDLFGATEDIKRFVKQNIVDLFDKLNPSVRKLLVSIMDFSTELAGRVDVLRQGGALDLVQEKEKELLNRVLNENISMDKPVAYRLYLALIKRMNAHRYRINEGSLKTIRYNNIGTVSMIIDLMRNIYDNKSKKAPTYERTMNNVIDKQINDMLKYTFS
jgi:hypothetical protein